MKPIEFIIKQLIQAIPEGCGGIITDLEYYDKEPGFGLQGDCVNIEGNFVRYMSYLDISEDIREFVHLWNEDSVSIFDRWNKARIVVYYDGRFDIKTWWDKDFQKSLYNIY